MPDKPKSGPAPLRKLRLTDWSRLFLAELAATSNVSAACEARRQSAEFNRAWAQALCEGYDLLEMDLLRRLRKGEVKPAAGAKRGLRTYDNATALRLLAAHRDSTARFRAVRTREESDAIVQSINAKLEKMRQRRIAAGRRRRMTDQAQIDDLMAQPEAKRLAWLRHLSLEEREEFNQVWPLWAGAAQLPPPGDWQLWLILAGRGFGKTRAGAEWIRDIAERDPAARIALVGASLGEIRSVMVEGESGLLSIGLPEQ